VENCGPLIQGWALKKKPATLVDMNCGVCDSYELSSCLVFIIYFGFFFLKEPLLIGLSSIVFEIWGHSPIEATLWTPVAK
jgi:hypothetical protein